MCPFVFLFIQVIAVADTPDWQKELASSDSLASPNPPELASSPGALEEPFSSPGNSAASMLSVDTVGDNSHYTSMDVSLSEAPKDKPASPTESRQIRPGICRKRLHAETYVSNPHKILYFPMC